MTRTRAAKIVRDLTQRWGRTVVVLAGLMASLFAAGAVAAAIAILSHDLDANFRRTDPANVAYDIVGLTPELMAGIAAIPGVAAADQRPVIGARIEVSPGRWLPFPIGVINDFEHMPLARIYSESGAWPPPPGTVLLERDGRPFFKAAPAGRLNVRLRDDSTPDIGFAGYAFDPAQGPSRMELTIYGYTTAATASAWSYTPESVRVLLLTRPEDAQRVGAEVERLVTAAGADVRRFGVFPRARYAHQFQLDAITAALAATAAMLMLIGVVLVAGLVGSLMTREQRVIGVMRALGGRSGQIGRDYLLGMGGLGLVAGLAMVIPALKGGMAITRLVAQGLNFNVLSPAPPGWVAPAMILAGVIVPVATAYLRVRRAVNMPVVRALARGAAPPAFTTRIGILPPLPRMAATAILRQPREALLPAAVLALGLAFFATVLNVRTSMLASIGAIAETRPYDLVVAFRDPYPAEAVAAWAKDVPQVVRAEAWFSRAGALYENDRIVSNSAVARGVPHGSTMITPIVLAGTWLDDAKPEGVVVNQNLTRNAPQVHVGGRYDLRVGGRRTPVEVIGIIKEFEGAAIYTQSALLEAVAERPGDASALYIATADRSLSGQRAAQAALDAHPLPAGWSLANIQTAGNLAASVQAHIVLVSGLLLFVAVLALLVGLFALASYTGVSVVQRFREIAVLKAIGGRAPAIAGLVLCEAVFVAVLGWALAMMLAPSISRFVTGIFGEAIIGYPFEYHAHSFGAPLTLLAGVVTALLAGAAPVRNAIATSVHRALRTE